MVGSGHSKHHYHVAWRHQLVLCRFFPLWWLVNVKLTELNRENTTFAEIPNSEVYDFSGFAGVCGFLTEFCGFLTEFCGQTWSFFFEFMVLQIFPTTSCKCCVKFEVPQCILQLNLHHQASKLGIKACNTQAKRIIIFYLAKIEMYMEIKINILQKASTQDPICWRVAEMSSAVKARIVSRQSSGTLRFLFFHKYKYTSHRFASGHVSFSFMDLNNSISETCSVKSYFCLKHGSGFKWAWFSFRIFSRAFPSPFGYSLSP